MDLESKRKPGLSRAQARARCTIEGDGQAPNKWSDSNIRTPSQQARLRMLESKDHWKILILVELWI
jgi:hypothetical protein